MTVLRGQVAVIRSDGSAVQPAPSGTTVNPGDEIRTLGSTSALITFFSDTEIELEQNTIIAIEQVSQQGDRVDISLRQAFGTTINRFQSLAGSGSTYRIEAGGAVALVRGTTFVVIGPITTSAGNAVILVCGSNCSPASTFAGCPLQPFTGFALLVDKGQVQSPCETFVVNLSAPNNATTADNQGTGTILDDDPPPSLSISDALVPAEGDMGTTTVTFTVSISTVSGLPVTVSFATSSVGAVNPANGDVGCAAPNTDYVSQTGTLNFSAGSTTSQTITVTICDDLAEEANETFRVNLSGQSNATLADDQGIGTITDDDAHFIISDVPQDEGTSCPGAGPGGDATTDTQGQATIGNDDGGSFEKTEPGEWSWLSAWVAGLGHQAGAGSP